MDRTLVFLFASLLLFFFKHFLFDFVFQTSYQLKNKGTYGHPGGLIHAGLHAMGSVPAILLMTQTRTFILALVVGEFLVHYHMDWSKEQFVKRLRLTSSDGWYWTTFGFDQFVHALTYLAMAGTIFLWAGVRTA